MKINRIAAHNFLGLSLVDMDLSASKMHLFAGYNGAGKTSVRHAITFALAGHCERVQLKAEFKTMVKEGAKKGDVTLTTDDGIHERDVSTGKLKNEGPGPHVPELLEYVLDPSRFAALKNNSRREVLFDLMKVEVSSSAVRAKLLVRGIPKSYIDTVHLDSGIEFALSFAKDELRSAKARWEAVTGEKYGPQKAEGWAPEAVEFDQFEYASRNDYHKSLQSQIEELSRKIGAAQQASTGRSQWLVEVDKVKDLASTVAKKQDLYNRAKLEHENHEKVTGEIELLIARARMQMTCPCCGVVLKTDPDTGNLIEADQAIQEDELPELEASLQRHLESLKMLANALENRRRDLHAALEAKTALDALMAREPDGGDVDIARLNGEFSNLCAKRDKTAEDLKAMETAKHKAATAQDQLEKATSAYVAASAWQKMADALSPDGIPAELLSAALEPFNEHLAASATITGWPPVRLDADMNITAGGRPYGLLSESEKWRVDAVIADAIGHFAGLRLLVLDRMDVLIPQNRPALFKWLVGRQADYDTILIMASAKERPVLPPMVRVWWLENGQVVEQEQVAA